MQPDNRNLKIYIAGKYTAETEGGRVVNVNRASDVAGALISLGHIPFIPHSLHWVDRRLQEHNFILQYEDFMNWGFAWLDICDALFLVNHSPGADREVIRAKEKGLKIYYRLIDVPDLAGGLDIVHNYFGHLDCLFKSDHINKELLE